MPWWPAWAAGLGRWARVLVTWAVRFAAVGIIGSRADTCARAADQAQSRGVIRSQAGPVALPIRGPGSFLGSSAAPPSRAVLLTGPADNRPGSSARPPAALMICPGKPAG